MSFEPMKCEKCESTSKVDGINPFGKDQEIHFSVSWRCSKCGETSADVCPFGPLIPTKNTCLNCGHRMEGDSCSNCSMTKEEMLIHGQASDNFIAEVNLCILNGSLRKALAILNVVLQKDIGSLEAWQMKFFILENFGFQKVKQDLLKKVLEIGGPKELLVLYINSLVQSNDLDEALSNIEKAFELLPATDQQQYLLEEKAWILAEKGNGAASLKAAEKALEQKETPRGHYLYGRALGLLGRLPEAKIVFEGLLQTDYKDDSLKAIRLIENVIEDAKDD